LKNIEAGINAPNFGRRISTFADVRYMGRELPVTPSNANDRFQRLCEDPDYVKFGEMHSVTVAPLLI